MTTYLHGQNMHPELQRGLAAATCSDRRWFADLPGEIVRLRPQFPEEAMAASAAAGSPPWLEIGFDHHGQLLPRTWVAVVDVLWLAGLPKGPGGKSGRVRIACPELDDAAMARCIAGMAADLVWQRFRRR
ncbi:MAG: hypothetical protein AAFX65_13845 [Cyanobacteria bacterium J06638_7]